MEGVPLPFDFLVLLELEELAPLGVILNFWVEEVRLGKPLAVEVVVPDSETNFGLTEDKREETVLATPFGCCEIAHELLGEVLHGVEGGLP